MAKVADAYLRIAEEHPERFVVIDSDRPPDVVHQDVRDALRRLVRSHTAIDTPAYGTMISKETLDASERSKPKRVPPQHRAGRTAGAAADGDGHGNGSGPATPSSPPPRRAPDRTDG